MISEPICHCGHVRDEHDEHGVCTVYPCMCIAYERDPDACLEPPPETK